MAASIPLQPVEKSGWLVGFGNMLDKEYGSWWRTRRALVHHILWFCVINGFLFLVGVDEGRRNPFYAIDELIQVFFQVGGLFATIGIIVVTQSAVFGERQLGTAEWVLSKPVTREAFLLSKFIVNGLSFLFLAIAIPSVVFFLQSLLHTNLQPDLGPFLVGLAILTQHLIFYLALTIALGTFMRSRGPVSGAGIGLLFAGLILPNFFPWLIEFTPFGLLSFAGQVARERPLPPWVWQPILHTALWTLLAVLVALWRFDREEF
jgi:ABC-2 type transport system permease protein